MGSSNAMLGQLRALWGRLGRTQRMALVGVAGGALVFGFIFLNMGRTQTFVTAFTNLDPKDSAAVVEQLKADGIAYQTSADGSTVKVPAEKLADARLKMAAKGLPAGGAVGFELFDKTSFGVTDFVQHVNYQRALEGELSRTINTLAQVEGSRVHIVVPKQELFVSQQKPATASVVLRLRSGRSLNEGDLKGIAHMIARSVEGLDEQNITILDAAGKLLYDGGSRDSSAGLSATQLEMQRAVEQGIEQQLQSLLDRVAGPSRAAVRVRADMDFAQSERLQETYTPGGPNNQGVPRSSASTQETYTGQPGTGGQPGTAANLPGTRAGAVAAGSGASQYQRTENTTNYEVNKDITKTVRGPGEIKRLSVSVLLDSSIPEQDALGLRDAVSAAAGINQQRGDQIVVTTAAFSNPQVDPIPVAKTASGGIFTYVKIAVPVLMAVVVIVIVWRMSHAAQPLSLKLRAETAQPALAAAGGGMFALAGQPGAPQIGQPAGAAGALDGPRGDTKALAEPAKSETPEQVRRRNEVYERMTNLATANPEAVVEIIHSWMQQDNKPR